MSNLPFFGVARPRTDASNAFDGVIDVAVPPSYFANFYAALVGEGQDGAEGKAVTLIRAEGQVLVRYPPFEEPPPLVRRPNAFFDAVRANPDGGTYVNRSVIDKDTPERLFVYRKVPGYPVYVVAGRSRAAILRGWERLMANHLVFGIPATVALFLVTWTALRRTRREQQALAQAREEMCKREIAEEALR